MVTLSSSKPNPVSSNVHVRNSFIPTTVFFVSSRSLRSANPLLQMFQPVLNRILLQHPTRSTSLIPVSDIITRHYTNPSLTKRHQPSRYTVRKYVHDFVFVNQSIRLDRHSHFVKSLKNHQSSLIAWWLDWTRNHTRTYDAFRSHPPVFIHLPLPYLQARYNNSPSTPLLNGSFCTGSLRWAHAPLHFGSVCFHHRSNTKLCCMFVNVSSSVCSRVLAICLRLAQS